MAAMWTSTNVLDKLPKWAQTTLMLLAIPASLYCIARYGVWHFILRAIFSP
ncbi:MAG: hypothetical protein V4555_14525 [Acidobacteriota bacterium]